MNRRELISRIAAGFTILSSSPAFAEVAARFSEAPADPQLNGSQLDLLASLVDCVIPATDTPGASAAGVHHFIDYLLEHWYGASDKATFQSGLAAIDAAAIRIHGAKVQACTTEQCIQLLTHLEALGKQPGETSSTSAFVAWLKELTVLGYYSSEIGATRELRYLATPGRYDGCIDFAEVGRTWAV